MWYWAEIDIAGSQGCPGHKDKVEIPCGEKHQSTQLSGVKENKEGNGSVGEMAKTGGHMILSGNTVFKAEFHNPKFTQRWAGRNSPETL